MPDPRPDTLFAPRPGPRLFATPPGVDFAMALVDGLRGRLKGHPPEAMARVELFVNTRRMQRRIQALFDQGPPGFLPRIRLLTNPEHLDPAVAPPASTLLETRLELARLVRQLIAAEPDLAPQTAAFDLADSLIALTEEMHGEGVGADVFRTLDVTDQSGHWARALSFLQLIAPCFDVVAPGVEARRRRALNHLLARWRATPPDHPVIVAGSTGSRGTTGMLMRAVARLPRGALILSGFDFDQPAHVWDSMAEAMTDEDHPQFRFARLLDALGCGPGDVQAWSGARAPCPARNRLVSLALRPAPVTDQWMTDGPGLANVGAALADVTLLEAASGREEAAAIALRLRKAAEDGKRAALISPDRHLARQVTAALDRWGIIPDDSAGLPLALSAPGRFLRHVAALFGQRLTTGAFLALLKHPLTNTGADARGQHLLWTRRLELWLRDRAVAFPLDADLTGWAAGDEDREVWAQWLTGLVEGHERAGVRELSEHIRCHLRLAEALAAGPSGGDGHELWRQAAGRAARELMEELGRAAGAGGPVSPPEYAALLHGLMAGRDIRDPDRPHPGILILGLLEARAQGADLVILGGLNEGVWPARPAPDPWLNRDMRRAAGLLLPERRIGLAAHDFQQAVAAPEVWLTRAMRDAEAETVPSRWLNRVMNLLNGLHGQGDGNGGAAALAAMRQRGEGWLRLTRTFEAPTATVAPAKRPAPRPPAHQRPRRLSVTRIETLIRDPYAIYAEHILRLKPLGPINPLPDAAARGVILHRVLERFLTEGGATRDDLMRIAQAVLNDCVPWPVARRLWLARLGRAADWFIETEARRRETATPLAPPEQQGELALEGVDFTLTAKADRFDRAEDGAILIYDYKTGKPPSPKEQTHFNKQLLLEAAMVERGGFPVPGPARVAGAYFIGLGAKPEEVQAPIDDPGLDEVWRQFQRLIGAWSGDGRGYTSRRAVATQRFEGAYDHLARFGEWNETDDPVPEQMP